MFSALFDVYLYFLLLFMKTNIARLSAVKVARFARAMTPASEKSRSFSICEGEILWIMLAK